MCAIVRVIGSFDRDYAFQLFIKSQIKAKNVSQTLGAKVVVVVSSRALASRLCVRRRGHGGVADEDGLALLELLAVLAQRSPQLRQTRVRLLVNRKEVRAVHFGVVCHELKVRFKLRNADILKQTSVRS